LHGNNAKANPDPRGISAAFNTAVAATGTAGVFKIDSMQNTLCGGSKALVLNCKVCNA
jgi:hypothetical protein